MSKFTIRPIRPDDLEPLMELCAEHAAYEGASFDRAGKVEKLHALFFSQPPRLRGTVAERDNRLVGYLTWSCEISTWDASEYAHVDCLYLRREARATGVAVALIKQLALDGRSLGVHALGAQWQTPPFNENAIKLYEALGAKRKDKARFYLPPALIERLADSAAREGRQPWYALGSPTRYVDATPGTQEYCDAE